MNAFFDSSALAKKYLFESGTERVLAILGNTSSLAISVLCAPEILSALNRRRREKSISRKEYENLKMSLFHDADGCSQINLTDPVVNRSVVLLERWPLRASDAIHVACAAEWAAELFVTADGAQAVAAKHYGLNVEFLGISKAT